MLGADLYLGCRAAGDVEQGAADALACGLPVVLADPGCVPADVAGKVRAGGIEAVLRFVASSMPAGWAGR
ncbi:hypothetical protein [Thauera humireducens]|uniref:hypothetical protein n=1 Tax=Thauera humireducens TaxID=1134435 RepID=UPI00311FEF4F